MSILVPPSFTRRSETRRAVFLAICPPFLARLIALAEAWRRGLVSARERHLMQLFVIVGTQRTGTNILRETLSTNPAIALAGEVFGGGDDSFEQYAAEAGLPRPNDYPEAERQLTDFLGQLHADRPPSVRLYGFDVKYSQLRSIAPRHEPLCGLPVLVQFMRLAGVRIIHVVRDNVLQASLSEMMAEARALWHHQGEGKIDGKVRIDGKALVRLMQVKRADRLIFSSVMEGHPQMITCEYERFVRGLAMKDAAGNLVGEDNPVFEIADFLGVERLFRDPNTLKKIVSSPYSELIENYDEVRRIVRRTEFATHLDTI